MTAEWRDWTLFASWKGLRKRREWTEVSAACSVKLVTEVYIHLAVLIKGFFSFLLLSFPVNLHSDGVPNSSKGQAVKEKWEKSKYQIFILQAPNT